jgi:hypothetical protein
MRCFNVLVHGHIQWLHVDCPDPEPDADRATGLYRHRYVIASSAELAKEKAIRRVREDLELQTGWFSEGRAHVEFLVDEVSPAPLFNAFLADNRRHTFYSGA